ncbi:MAG: cell division protein FtsA [Candidatus Sungbacteria bacterium]|uniref:Cell division protein FtsA n=1 Tax=Candidatus Sungiibacteriota bacterium TaxID=2750080 RepID=A0A9D6LU74_9BACT|nr:cell division protein FtsA [Candidatus Sungbacteria bacterium]
MPRDIVLALDVGTSMVHALIAECKPDETPRILGIGIAPAAGIRKGAVIDLDEAGHSIKVALYEAAKEAGLSPKSCFVSIGGPHLLVSSSRGVVAVSRADGDVSEEDVRRVLSAAETFIPKNPNREILHIIPREFRVDNEGGIKDPVGMNGVRLEVDALIVDASVSAIRNLSKCIEAAGCKITEFVFSPLASAAAVLSKRQKELGVILIDIGGGTTNFAVFEEGRLVHAGGFPYGTAHITNDIAIVLQTRVDVAELIKLKYGHAIPEEISKKESIHLSEFVAEDDAVFPRREIAEIIEARFSDIFELVNKEIKKINKTQLLPAGAVLIGGGSRIPGVLQIAKRELHLPCELGDLKSFSEYVHERDRAQLATAIGLLEWRRTKSSESLLSLADVEGGGAPSWLKKLYSLLFP